MKEPKAMAYVNMYGVLGALENLVQPGRPCQGNSQGPQKACEPVLPSQGRPLLHLPLHPGGLPHGRRATEAAPAKWNFSSPEKFNALIDENKPGLPGKNPVQLLPFLLGPFTQLTNRLTELLRPSEEALQDRAFFEKSTVLTMYTIAGAISALANTDSISQISASYTVDGEISLGIRDVAQVTISVQDHRFTTIKAPAEHPRAIMEFATIDLAYGLFTGQVSTINEMCKGTIHLRGMLSMVDNINRILNRVSAYLS